MKLNDVIALMELTIKSKRRAADSTRDVLLAEVLKVSIIELETIQADLKAVTSID